MSAPLNNDFWNRRSSHGRKKLFESPELLWEAACEYFNWCVENPLIETVHDKLRVNGEGDRLTMVELPKMRPFTLGSLALYLDCSTEYLRHFEDNNKDSKDFMPVITRIKETIYTQKFEGAACGMLNPNIIARDLGLIDRKETEIKGGLNIPNLPDIGNRK